MIHKFLLPQLSMGMSEGMIIEWLATEGALVKKDEPLVNVETEKVVLEIPAPYAGYLHIEVKAGDTVPIETTIANLVDNEEEYRSLIAVRTTSASGKGDSPSAVESTIGNETSNDSVSSLGKRISVSGLARKLADQQGFELSKITGTGPSGRIVRRDILAYAEMLSSATSANSSPSAVGSTSCAVRSERSVKKIPLAGMRKTIAERVLAAKNSTASTYLFFDIDVSNLLQIRETYLAREADLATRISLTTLYVKALAKALEMVPICNATLENDVISMWGEVNVGIAVSLPGKNDYESGLIVPVVKRVGEKSLLLLDREIKDLVRRARQRELTTDELEGATVTLSSTAGFFPDGWMVSAPILNQPQVINFQPGSILKKPLVVGNDIAVRDVLPCGLTFDHRAMDGEPAGRLARQLNEFLAHPELLLL